MINFALLMRRRRFRRIQRELVATRIELARLQQEKTGMSMVQILDILAFVECVLVFLAFCALCFMLFNALILNDAQHRSTLKKIVEVLHHNWIGGIFLATPLIFRKMMSATSISKDGVLFGQPRKPESATEKPRQDEGKVKAKEDQN